MLYSLSDLVKSRGAIQQFYNELTNSCCGANLLTYMAKIRLKDLYEVGFSVNNITIPKGNYCGLFSPSFGGGSTLEMELKHDVTLRLSEGGNKWYRMVIDDGNNLYCRLLRRIKGSMK